MSGSNFFSRGVFALLSSTYIRTIRDAVVVIVGIARVPEAFAFVVRMAAIRREVTVVRAVENAVVVVY